MVPPRVRNIDISGLVSRIGKARDKARPVRGGKGKAAGGQGKSGPGKAAGGKTAPGRRGSRIALVAGAVAVVVVAAVVAAVSLSSPPPKPPAPAPVLPVTVSGQFNKKPALKTARPTKPGKVFAAKTVIKGNGAPVAKGDLAVVGYASYLWRGTNLDLLDDGYRLGRPAVMRIGELIPGLNNGLTGQRVGSRVVMSIPPADGYGRQGRWQSGINATDTLLYVVDLLGTYPATASARGTARTPEDSGLPTVAAGPAGRAPTVTVPDEDPPGELKAETLIEGSGPPVKKSQMVVAHYQGQTWDGGKVFDSSWRAGRVVPLSSLDTAMPGWVKGLDGKKVGSRVLLVIPPEDGFSKKGAERMKIKSTDTTVFVVDLLGAY